jgi:cellulose synthase/poly-beta-1,6-N-acetylglucosamine synthase-like glycosyltransferase
MSFNGTAGVWRREAIDNGGGWTGDTLTEDLDLAMRCAMKGWRGALMADIEVPGELPETAAAWRAQQARWTKGHAQVARTLLPQIWSSDMPLWQKTAMSLQMCQFAFYTLAFASAALSLTLMYMGGVTVESVATLGLWVSGLGLVSSLGYLFIGQAALGRGSNLLLAPSLLLGIVFPSGLILSNTRATFEAFFSTRMDFKRTQRAGEAYAGTWRGGPELLVGVVLPLFAFAERAWSAPFFVFAVAGLVSIGLMGLNGSPAPARQIREIAPGE